MGKRVEAFDATMLTLMRGLRSGCGCLSFESRLAVGSMRQRKQAATQRRGCGGQELRGLVDDLEDERPGFIRSSTVTFVCPSLLPVLSQTLLTSFPLQLPFTKQVKMGR